MPTNENALIEWASVMYNAAWYAREQGNYADALEMATFSMTARWEQLGGESEITLWSMAMVAFTYRNQGRWTEAEQLEVEVMETRKAVLGEEHADTLTSMGNLRIALAFAGTDALPLAAVVHLGSKTVPWYNIANGIVHTEERNSET